MKTGVLDGSKHINPRYWYCPGIARYCPGPARYCPGPARHCPKLKQLSSISFLCRCPATPSGDKTISKQQASWTRKELKTGLTLKKKTPLSAFDRARKQAQLDKYSASLKKAIEEAMQPVLTKIDGRADKTDDLIKGLGDLMLGHVDLGKLS